MFIDDLKNLKNLAVNTNFAIFVTKNSEIFSEIFPENRSLFVMPGENGKITIDQIREVIEFCVTRQVKDFFIIITKAECMNEQAENALLKLLEEPAEHYHFVVQVADASALLPTILSRGNLYIERIKKSLSKAVSAESAQRLYAKRIISAKSAELPALVKALTVEKEYKKDARGFTLGIVGIAIETLYKSFFATKNPDLLKRLAQLLTLYDNLMRNGHIKLHLVADLC